MAKARLLAPWVGEERRSAIYHCVSRVVDRNYIFGDAEREQFVELMRLYEEFCGLRVLSFCVMSNHFHILVEVPPNMAESLSDEALVARLAKIYGRDYVGMVSCLSPHWKKPRKPILPCVSNLLAECGIWGSL